MQQQVSNLRENFQSFKDFAVAFNPKTQVEFGRDERKSIMADYSTLAMLDMALGENSSSNWLSVAIGDLNIFCGSKSMSNDQIEDLADFIASEYKDIKFSMMQLFFYRFKRGDFGKFYGKVDPMVITCALKDFVEECAKKRDEYLTEEYEAQRKKENETRQGIYKKWHLFFAEFMKEVKEEDKDDLSGVCIEKVFELDNCIRIETTKDQYNLLEGVYFNTFSRQFQKLLPGISIQYKVKKPSPEAVKQQQDSNRNIQQINEQNISLSSAKAVIDNIYDLPKDGIIQMRNVFFKRYGCTPEEYLKNNHQTNH